jgi:hypothetical protein
MGEAAGQLARSVAAHEVDVQEASIPAWTVNVQYRAGGDYKTKFEATLSRGSGPDSDRVRQTDVPKYSAAGALAPLTSPTSRTPALAAGLTKAGSYNGKLYAVPYYAGARGVIYRTDQYKAGRDHEDAEDARRVRPRRQKLMTKFGGKKTRTTRPSTSRAGTGTPRCRSSTTTADRSRRPRTASGSARSTRRRRSPA